MEVAKRNTKVAMETVGEARNLNTKSKIAESRFASSDEIVVDQLRKLNAKNKNTTKSPQTWRNLWEKWARSTSTKISIKTMFYAEVCTKDGFFYNFVENIINKKSYDRSCILKFSNCTRLRLVQF